MTTIAWPPALQLPNSPHKQGMMPGLLSPSPCCSHDAASSNGRGGRGRGGWVLSHATHSGSHAVSSVGCSCTAVGGSSETSLPTIASRGFDVILSTQDSMPQSPELIATRQRSRRVFGRPAVLEETASVDESISWTFNRSETASNVITQIIGHLQPGLIGKDPRARMINLAVIASVLGLQVTSQAWAGPEVAQINSNSTFDLGDFSDIQSGFASAFLLIFFSEIGDKTFFIAALLATRKSGIAVFSGTFGALATMTVISVFLGRIFHYIDGILPSFGDVKVPVDDIAAVILLVYFGVSTLLEASSMEDSESGEEQQEAELAIAGVGAGGAVAGTVAATFALVFVAEWGDKSFFSTIALAAASSPLGVVTGAIGGHGAATLLAVLGGSFLGSYISEKVIAYIGGTLFLVFAGVTLFEILY